MFVLRLRISSRVIRGDLGIESVVRGCLMHVFERNNCRSVASFSSRIGFSLVFVHVEDSYWLQMVCSDMRAILSLVFLFLYGTVVYGVDRKETLYKP